jgi:hypothetical protein
MVTVRNMNELSIVYGSATSVVKPQSRFHLSRGNSKPSSVSFSWLPFPLPSQLVPTHCSELSGASLRQPRFQVEKKQ